MRNKIGTIVVATLLLTLLCAMIAPASARDIRYAEKEVIINDPERWLGHHALNQAKLFFMIVKSTKFLIALFVISTLFLNLINVAFVENYENTYGGYNRILISSAGNDSSKLKEACQNIKQPTEKYLVYKKITTWSFVAMMILLAVIIIEFALAKSKIILFSPKDWKHLRIITFAMFLSSFLFVYAYWILTDDYYLLKCLSV